MSEQTLQLDASVQQYLHDISLREPPACRRLRERTRERDDGGMISSPEQTQLLAFLARLMGAQRVLEVGTFTGYTALWLALTLPEEARLTCIDRDEDTLREARAAWDEAGVGERIEVRVGEARTELDRLFDEDEAATFDLAYIDADKENQLDYFEACLKLVRPGGLVAVDNVLWQGRVAHPEWQDETTEAVRAFNRSVYGDERIDLSVVPIGDGLTLACRREHA